MNNSKLINVLRTFSKSEIKEFEKFVISPFFNAGRNYLPLVSILKKFHPRFDDEKMTPQFIYKKLYPGKKFNQQIMWNMSSSLLNLAEGYLLYSSLKKNKFIKKNLVAEEYERRKLGTYFFKALDELESVLERMGIDGNYFKFKSELELGRIRYHFLEDKQHLLSENILRKGEYSAISFLKDISDYINDSTANVKMFNAKFDFSIPAEFIKNMQLQNIVDYTKKNNYKYSWALEMYYCSVMMIMEAADPKYFFRLKKLFEENYGKFNHDEREQWITILSNYCINKTDEEENQFRNILFELNKFQLREFDSSGAKHLAKIRFIQILRTALSVNETGWVKTYIEDYVPKLKNSFQKPMRALANAFLGLKLKDHDSVIENLSKVKFIDIRDKLNVKSLYVRVYYELNEIETLLYNIDSTRRFVNKNSSISDATKKKYNLFLNTLNRLVAARETNDRFEIEKLRNEIEGDNDQIFGGWLTEKIAEIQKI